MTDTMRVWVGCLACYNAGLLGGTWVDAIDASELTPELIHATIPNTALPPFATTHDELWVMDSEGYGGLLTGECSPMEAQRIAELVAELDDTERDAFGAYVANGYGKPDADTLAEFQDNYRGRWDSELDYAYDLAGDIGFETPNTWPAQYIDWQAATRDLFMDYWSVNANEGGIHVFSN